MKELTNEDKMLGLKEPKEKGENIPKAVISVLGTDRVGIIATISQSLAQYNANILQINQNILEGLFAMIMIVDTNEITIDFDQLKHTLEGKSEDLGVTVTVQSEEVFRYMHRI